MVGKIDGSHTVTDSEVYKSLIELVPLENDWQLIDTKHRRYSIDPKDILRVQKQARSQGLNIIGVYHSHPDHVAVPSECDRTQAWPEYAYVIVSVQGKESGNKAVDIQNWTLDSKHQFQLEAMQVSPLLAPDQVPIRMQISA